jgi:DNA-3-methyladenine glycosylase
MRYKRLRRNFFARETQLVAHELVGKLVIRMWKNQKIIGRITEVESYVGENDLASHAARGRTLRTELMFGPAGYAYIYLIYGMYDCFNIVTDKTNVPAAVLLRALEPLEGIEYMMSRRHVTDERLLTTGPGKLTQALAITRQLNGEDLVTSQRLFIADDGLRVTDADIATSPRIGVDYAGASALLPWRYFLKRSLFVSRHSK